MRSSATNHPANEPLIVVRSWQLKATDGNHCAAMLLALFGAWHDEGPDRMKDCTESALMEGILGFYKEKTLRSAIALLVGKGFISIPSVSTGMKTAKSFSYNVATVNSWIDSRGGDHE